MIMVTMFGTPVAAPRLGKPAFMPALLAAAKRAWIAYVNWRIERAAIDQLFALSDRELEDIGLIRSEITDAAKVAAAAVHPPRRRVLD
jgi:uncharacterized protein YjiS (DUF1127 family)